MRRAAVIVLDSELMFDSLVFWAQSWGTNVLLSGEGFAEDMHALISEFVPPDAETAIELDIQVG